MNATVTTTVAPTRRRASSRARRHKGTIATAMAAACTTEKTASGGTKRVNHRSGSETNDQVARAGSAPPTGNPAHPCSRRQLACSHGE